jgi:hypothetical protein
MTVIRTPLTSLYDDSSPFRATHSTCQMGHPLLLLPLAFPTQARANRPQARRPSTVNQQRMSALPFHHRVAGTPVSSPGGLNDFLPLTSASAEARKSPHHGCRSTGGPSSTSGSPARLSPRSASCPHTDTHGTFPPERYRVPRRDRPTRKTTDPLALSRVRPSGHQECSHGTRASYRHLGTTSSRTPDQTDL